MGVGSTGRGVGNGSGFSGCSGSGDVTVLVSTEGGVDDSGMGWGSGDGSTIGVGSGVLVGVATGETIGTRIG
jgi:hypothetical protein